MDSTHLINIFIIIIIGTQSLRGTDAIRIDRQGEGDVIHDVETCTNNNWKPSGEGTKSCFCYRDETAIDNRITNSLVCSKSDNLGNSGNHGDISLVEDVSEADLKFDMLKKKNCNVESASVWNYNGTIASWDASWSTELLNRIQHNSKSGKTTIAMTDSENWQGLLIKLDLSCQAATAYSTLLKVKGLRSYPITSPLLAKPKGNATPTTAQRTTISTATPSTTRAIPSTSEVKTTKLPSKPTPSTRQTTTNAFLPKESTGLEINTKNVRPSLILGLALGFGSVAILAAIIIITVKAKRRGKKKGENIGEKGIGSTSSSHHASKIKKMFKRNAPLKSSAQMNHAAAQANPAYMQLEDSENSSATYQATNISTVDITYMALNNNTVYAQLPDAEQGGLNEQVYTALDTISDQDYSMCAHTRGSVVTGNKAQTEVSKNKTLAFQLMPKLKRKDPEMARSSGVAYTKHEGAEPQFSNEEDYTAIGNTLESVYLPWGQAAHNAEFEVKASDDLYRTLSTSGAQEENVYTTPGSTTERNTISRQPHDHRSSANARLVNKQGSEGDTFKVGTVSGTCSSTDEEPDYREIDLD